MQDWSDANAVRKKIVMIGLSDYRVFSRNVSATYDHPIWNTALCRSIAVFSPFSSVSFSVAYDESHPVYILRENETRFRRAWWWIARCPMITDDDNDNGAILRCWGAGCFRCCSCCPSPSSRSSIFSSSCFSGFLRSDTLIGTVTVKLQPLETQCEIHDSFPVGYLNFKRRWFLLFLNTFMKISNRTNLIVYRL